RMGVSANVNSILGGCTWLLSIPAIIYSGWCFQQSCTYEGWLGLLLSAAMWNIGFILDVADGSIARMTHTSSSAGFFLDFSWHLVFNPMFTCSIGVFLNMVTGHPVYLLLGVLSICGNWAPAIEAREHVLCDLVATGKCEVDRLPSEQRHLLFAASPRYESRIETKTQNLLPLVRSLAVELLCFPGQFMLFGLAVLVDAVIARTSGELFPVVRVLFIAVSVLLTSRTPLALRREYVKLQRLDRLMKP
ncbi:MAG: CDP-alcohol phosphatidyltransferase family protein, partial [Rhodopirellula sp.]|nr:CDP-alcohol phosphatidyltransferase family protein [Rhodopirellula sp.]